MASTAARNPASRYALTRSDLSRMLPGTKLLVCTMNPYDTYSCGIHSTEARIDGIVPVTLLGMRPRPRRSQDLGSTYWIVLDRKLVISDYSTTEVGIFQKRYAYEPHALGLASARLLSGVPVWDEMICIIRPEYEQAFRNEYPRPLPL